MKRAGVKVVVALLLLYGAFGFFGMPYFAKKEFLKFAKENINASVTLDAITFNPFIHVTILNSAEADFKIATRGDAREERRGI